VSQGLDDSEMIVDQ